MWILGIKLRSSRLAVSTLPDESSHQAPKLNLHFLICKIITNNICYRLSYSLYEKYNLECLAQYLIHPGPVVTQDRCWGYNYDSVPFSSLSVAENIFSMGENPFIVHFPILEAAVGATSRLMEVQHTVRRRGRFPQWCHRQKCQSKTDSCHHPSFSWWSVLTEGS